MLIFIICVGIPLFMIKKTVKTEYQQQSQFKKPPNMGMYLKFDCCCNTCYQCLGLL